MNSCLSLLIILSLFNLPHIFAQKESKGDFTYDPETKSVKPKYLGKVFLLKGSVKSLSSTGKETHLKNQSKIFPGDKIITEDRSIIKVEMIDTTVITVAPRSIFEFSQWDYKTKDNRDSLFKVVKGRIRSHIKVKNKKKGSLKYQVGSVSMGIRGTRILANTYQRLDKIKVSHVVVLAGKAEIYDSAADKKLNLEGGHQYISFLKPDGTLLKNESTILSREQLKQLKATDKNPRKYFKPFVPFITSKSLKTVKNIKGRIDNTTSSNRHNSDQEENSATKKKKSWKNTLDKLNKRLLEQDD
jgi:hypothetical protein